MEFAKSNKGVIFRYWIYKRIFTPYEEEECYEDESIFEDSLCSTGYIKEVIEFSDGDALIGFLDNNDCRSMRYCLLSEIRLEKFLVDQEDGCDDEDDYVDDVNMRSFLLYKENQKGDT